MQLTPTFLPLLLQFSGDFTQPTCVTFMALMTGWLLSHRRRFITELIQSSDSTHTGHHSRYHRFFSHAAWSLDAIGCTLARFLVTLFAPTGLVELAVDDTLCRKPRTQRVRARVCTTTPCCRARASRSAPGATTGSSSACSFVTAPGPLPRSGPSLCSSASTATARA